MRSDWRLKAVSLLVLGAAIAAVVLLQTKQGDARKLGVSSSHRSATTGCSAGAHTLAPAGSRLYPDTGNGGYQSIRTVVYLVYNAASDHFLPGNHVELTDRATQCLTSFSLDFERTSANKMLGPNMHVQTVTVNGKQAAFQFVQPTYPGDPNGWNDPNPQAREASQVNPVGGPNHNPLPPACSPELPSRQAAEHSQDGQPCPANKLMITPAAAIPDGALFKVVVNYTGKPGVHNDGDGSTEGWFRTADGGFVITEPVGSEDWMPLNDYPTAKPTYGFFATVNAGKTAISNGVLLWKRKKAPNSEFPKGSVTWHWYSPAPIASYLVEATVGNYALSERTADNGVKYYEAQDRAIPAAQRQRNLSTISQQQNVTEYQTQFNGAYPFTSDGALIGTPHLGQAEEMQTMSAFTSSQTDMPQLYHENAHQWWGDNVTAADYRYVFFKEGFATLLGQELYPAQQAELAAGGPYSTRGESAFETTLDDEFDTAYGQPEGFWARVPSNPIAYHLYDYNTTYWRPAASYIALRLILGPANFVHALLEMQRLYGGATITEQQEEAAFERWLPSSSAACHTRLQQFFTQWFDTSYPSHGKRRPNITASGLMGGGFYKANGTCSG